VRVSLHDEEKVIEYPALYKDIKDTYLKFLCDIGIGIQRLAVGCTSGGALPFRKKMSPKV
jgi:hypothetical protein